MQLLNAGYEILGETPRDIATARKFIEAGGRTCYKSESEICDDSAIKFVKKMVNSGHHSVIEHSNLVLVIRSPSNPMQAQDEIFALLGERMKYHKVEIHRGNVYIAGNYRAWHQTRESIEAHDHFAGILGLHLFEAITRDLDEIFNYDYDERESNISAEGNIFCPLSEKEEIPQRLRQYTVRVVCDRGVTHEIVRHRPFAYSQESTRYVNYNNRGVAFIIPVWAKNIMPKSDHEGFTKKDRESWTEFEMEWVNAMSFAESKYRFLGDKTKPGYWTPEKARSVFPNSLKTEIVITGFAEDWDWMRHMRVPKAAHPQYREISVPMFREFYDRGYLTPSVGVVVE